MASTTGGRTARRTDGEARAITVGTLDGIRHAALRAEAAAALGRGETVRFLCGAERGGERVETIVLGSGRAAQSGGESVTWGDWRAERLLTDRGGHALDREGMCTCRDCDASAGYCIDDDE